MAEEVKLMPSRRTSQVSAMSLVIAALSAAVAMSQGLPLKVGVLIMAVVLLPVARILAVRVTQLLSGCASEGAERMKNHYLDWLVNNLRVGELPRKSDEVLDRMLSGYFAILRKPTYLILMAFVTVASTSVLFGASYYIMNPAGHTALGPGARVALVALVSATSYIGLRDILHWWFHLNLDSMTTFMEEVVQEFFTKHPTPSSTKQED